MPPEPVNSGKNFSSQEQEVDLWWGAYSSWALVPSLVICLLLTGFIVWGSWMLLQRALVQRTVVSLAGLIWLVQILRWSNHIFGNNYRLTTHRLFKEKGLLRRQVRVLDLVRITRVEIQQTPLERVLGVGRILLMTQDATKPAMILEAIHHPEPVAEMIGRRSMQKLFLP